MEDIKPQSSLINTILIALAIVIAGALIAGAILVSGEWGMKVGNAPLAEQTIPTPPPAANGDAASNGANDSPVKVSVDDDAYLGDKARAKLAIVEFSDFECPFCKRFHQDTFDKLVKEYVETGKAIFVFRDFPLSFHEPMASKEANAAECVRKQAGNQAFFNFAQGIFTASAGNGQGVSDEKLNSLATNAGAKQLEDFKSCVQNETYKEDIAQDMADGTEAGISGTPGFVIGALAADGTVTGVNLVGAQPFENFKKVLDGQL